ncbi:MAG: LysM domain-containing protein [Pseudomonadota bacterium]
MRAIFLVLVLLAACHPHGPARQGQGGRGHAVYTIAWGDTLEGIAWRYEVPGGYAALAHLNHLRDPNLILAGDHLRIPRTGPATAGLPPWPALPPVRAPLEACPMEHARQPMPAAVQGCTQAACVDIEGGRRVCSCVAAQGSSGFLVMEVGRLLAGWPAPVDTFAGEDETDLHGTTTDFDVSLADLDGDGRREALVAFRASANDVGMSWWRVAVLSGAQPQAQPLLLSAANWGEGSLVRGDGVRCDLLSTTWEYGWEPGRAPTGWYLLGRPMRYQQGALAPVPDRPIYSRRLLYSFQPGAVHTPAGLALGTPARDLSSRAAAERLTEPHAELPLWEENASQVLAMAPRIGDDGQVERDLTLRWGDTDRVLTWSPWGDGYAGLGDESTRRLYPPGYRPAQITWPQGQPVMVSSYQLMWYDQRNVVWVQ